VTWMVDGTQVFHSAFENALNVKSGLVFSSTGGATQLVGQQGTQAVTYTDSFGSCYKRSVATASNALVSVDDGTACPNGNRVNWLAQPDGASSQAMLQQLFGL